MHELRFMRLELCGLLCGEYRGRPRRLELQFELELLGACLCEQHIDVSAGGRVRVPGVLLQPPYLLVQLRNRLVGPYQLGVGPVGLPGDMRGRDRVAPPHIDRDSFHRFVAVCAGRTASTDNFGSC